MSILTVLGLDPSFVGTGWSVLTYDASKNRFTQVVECGWIETHRSKKVPVTFDDICRSYTVAKEIQRLIDKYKPAIVCSEIPLGSQSASAAKSLGIAKGIVCAVCSINNITARFINPLAVKLSVCGKRNAEKQEVIKAVEKLLPVVRKQTNRLNRNGKFTKIHEARCDAIAVALATMVLNGRYNQLPDSVV